jgi:hypothetical protein
MSYIGSSAAPLPVAFAGMQGQSFNGGTNTFTLSRAVSRTLDIDVVINNVAQNPYDGSYSVNGTTLTTAETVSAGVGNVYVIYRDAPIGSFSPIDGSVTTAKIGDSAVTAAKLAPTAITDKLGYTPVNKAGDTINGDLTINGYVSRTDSSNNVGWAIATTAGRAYMVLDSNSTNGVGSGSDYLYLGSDYVNVRNELTVYNSVNGNTFKSDSGATHVYKPLRVKHSVGGEWAVLGAVYGGSGSYIHVKTTLSKSSNRMCGFRLTGYYPYSAYGLGFLGCYTYAPTDPNPYGLVVHNAGNHNVANTMYYSSDGFVVLVLYWPTSYSGVLVEHIANGSDYGVAQDISIAAYTKSNSTTGVY